MRGRRHQVRCPEIETASNTPLIRRAPRATFSPEGRRTATEANA
jgi:hypothetical protein